jgi:EmrB/QacA subfamily drug resistance transporter
MTYLGLTVGPSLGGLLAQHVGWRSVFYINVPVGAAALFLSARFILRDEPQRARPPFDGVGAALFFLGLLALLVALNRGHAWGWISPPLLLLFVSSAGVLFAFVRRERRIPHPMLDLRLFERRAFSSAAVSAVLNYVCVYGIVFLVPFYLIQGRGLLTGQAGALLTAQPLAMMISAPISGTLSDRIGVRIPAMAGMAVLSVGLFLLSRLGAHTPFAQVELALVVCGLGTGTFIAPNNSGLMGAAPSDKQGIAAGVLATARNAGMVLGVGISGAILTTVLQRGGDSAVVRAVGTGLFVNAALAAVGVLTAALR